jgi:hypothetical protein
MIITRAAVVIERVDADREESGIWDGLKRNIWLNRVRANISNTKSNHSKGILLNLLNFFSEYSLSS